ASEYKKFVAVVGCPEQVAGPVQVLIDDRVVWERAAISSLSPAEQIEIAIPAGAKTLTLQSGAEGLYYGFAAFAEAGFVRYPGPLVAVHVSIARPIESIAPIESSALKPLPLVAAL